MRLKDVKKELSFYSNISKAKILRKFFKTSKGEYGEGDIFLGLTVPQTRKIAKKFIALDLFELKKLLYSRIHEERLCALLILVEKYNIGDERVRKEIFNFYIKNAERVNNWDLVDLSSPKIVGRYLLNRNKKILHDFSKTDSLWKRRIAMVSTHTFIRSEKYKDVFKIAKTLIKDEHDLVQKAVGWMLREVGKRSLRNEEIFLKKFYKKMPRTMLRYAIEKFPETKRLKYLKK